MTPLGVLKKDKRLKLESNAARDAKQLAELKQFDWKVVVIWSFDLNERKRLQELKAKLVRMASELLDIRCLIKFKLF